VVVVGVAMVIIMKVLVFAMVVSEQCRHSSGLVMVLLWRHCGDTKERGGRRM